MSDIAIRVENLSKAYRIGLKEEIPDSLMSAATGWMRAPLKNFRRLRRLNTFGSEADHDEDTLWALKDVSFDVKQGEVVGIIGRNGAGKSTLLKVLSRITEPTSGRAVIHGRVSSLLEVGTGFHPELTGRENIYLNGTILGMKKREIDRKFDEIVEFSGVERFLDTPTKRYSSGMTVRLAFAVAAHLDPEILIIDEVLAVGDAEFQKKCLGKMQDVAASGRTVLFVSHNMGAVGGLCKRGIWLDGATVRMNEEVRTTIAGYVAHSAGANTGDSTTLVPQNELTSRYAQGFEVRAIEVSAADGSSKQCCPMGSQLTFSVTCYSDAELVAPIFLWSVRNQMGQRITDFMSSRCGARLPQRVRGHFSVSCKSHDLFLAPGEYDVELAIQHSGEWFFRSERAARISIIASDFLDSPRVVSAREICVVSRQSWELMTN